jgi:alpha-tubulin suppressor-like RCC1 family protein
MAAMAGVRVRSVAAGHWHSLALGWDGRVYSWGSNSHGQLGHGDTLTRLSPTLMEGLEGVRSIAASDHSLAVTQSGDVFGWGLGPLLRRDMEHWLRPIIVEGFWGVRMGSVCAGASTAFAIGGTGELFSWGQGKYGLLGHGDEQDQPSPKRVAALRGVWVSSVSVGEYHALALAEDGLVYAWSENVRRALLGDPHVERELLPKPVEALRGMRVGSVAASDKRSYAVADTGELWAWGGSNGSEVNIPLGHGEQIDCPLPKAIESLRGVKLDGVTCCVFHSLALADDGGMYAWGGDHFAVKPGALGLGPSVINAGRAVINPQRIPALRVACGL